MRAWVLGVVRHCVIASCCGVVATSVALAQAASGVVSGTVSDQAGAPVPGAAVTVTNLETSRQRTVVSSGADPHKRDVSRAVVSLS